MYCNNVFYVVHVHIHVMVDICTKYHSNRGSMRLPRSNLIKPTHVATPVDTGGTEYSKAVPKHHPRR